VLRLPEPMLARSGAIPSSRGWTFEPKLDDVRALVCTHDGLRVRSRRGWDMSDRLPELAEELPAGVQLDGELVALDADGRLYFHRLGSRMLHGRSGIPVVLFVFDVLAVEGLPTTMQPYLGRAGAARAARPGDGAGAARGYLRGRGGAVRGRLRTRTRGRSRETLTRRLPLGRGHVP